MPRALRQDAVTISVAFLARLDADWRRVEAEGADLVVTTGEFATDPALHGPSEVAGEARFVVDIRSVSDATMKALEAKLRTDAAEVAADTGCGSTSACRRSRPRP